MGGRGGGRGLLGGRGAVWQRGSGLGVPQLGPGCRGGAFGPGRGGWGFLARCAELRGARRRLAGSTWAFRLFLGGL